VDVSPSRGSTRFEPDAADRLVLRPRWGFAGGRVRERVLEIQRGLLEELASLDEAAQRMVDRRAVVVDGLRQCRDALGGVGIKFAPRPSLPGDVDAAPEGTRELSGRRLRAALVAQLRAAGRSLTIEELHRGLLVRGVRPRRPPAKTISNALSVEVRCGRVLRVRRGEYASVSG
jgi:hypothetical protein